MQNAESQPQENSGRSPICVTDFKARKRPPKFRFRIQCVAQQNSGDCEIWFAVSKMQNADFNSALADSPRLAQESVIECAEFWWL